MNEKAKVRGKGRIFVEGSLDDGNSSGNISTKTNPIRFGPSGVNVNYEKARK